MASTYDSTTTQDSSPITRRKKQMASTPDPKEPQPEEDQDPAKKFIKGFMSVK